MPNCKSGQNSDGHPKAILGICWECCHDLLSFVYNAYPSLCLVKVEELIRF